MTEKPSDRTFATPDELESDDRSTNTTAAPAVAPAAPAKPDPTRGARPASATAGAPGKAATGDDMIKFVQARPGLSAKRRRELVSAWRSLGRLLHLPPRQIPADIGEVRRRLEGIHPAAAKISPKRFANIKADLAFGLSLAERTMTGARARPPLSPPWRSLLDRCPTRWLRVRLMRFARWCSGRGIAPEEVDLATLDAFMADLERTTLGLKSAALRRQTAMSWNKCVGQAPSWPQHMLEVRPAREPWTRPWEAFLPEFRRDVDLCLDRLAGADPLDEDGLDRPLRPATLKWRRFQIRAAASSLVAAGVPPEEIGSLADLLRPERFKLLIRNLLQRYGKKTGFIYGLATAMKTIARCHCRFEGQELDALRAICRRVLLRQRGLTPKNRDRLRPFVDPETRDRLLLLPQQLMQQACRESQPSRRSAIMAQLAVALEIVLMAPLRAANLVSLEIGRQLVFLGRGRQEQAVITLPEKEVKNEITLEYPLPPESTRLIKRYIERFLPLLAEPGSLHLFPSPQGSAKLPGTLGRQVAAVVREATGHRIHLHLLRHLAATIYLQAHPGAYAAVQRILGHATASAAIDAYVGLESSAAARHFDETVLRLRRQAEAMLPPRRGRRS
jgi:integrase